MLWWGEKRHSNCMREISCLMTINDNYIFKNVLVFSRNKLFCFPDNAFMLYYKGSPDFASSIRNYKPILLVWITYYLIAKDEKSFKAKFSATMALQFLAFFSAIKNRSICLVGCSGNTGGDSKLLYPSAFIFFLSQ